MRRALLHPLAPTLGCAVLCVAYLLASPATADMAAHSYRAWLFEHEGMTVWNAQWYGGHHVLGYSLLFAPLAATFGPAFVGVVRRGGRRRAVRPAGARGGAVAGRGRGRRVAVHGRRAVERGDRADAVPARDRAGGRRVVGGARRSGACSPACSDWPRCSPARSRACS